MENIFHTFLNRKYLDIFAFNVVFGQEHQKQYFRKKVVLLALFNNHFYNVLFSRFHVHRRRDPIYVFTKPIMMPVKSEQLRKLDRQQVEMEKEILSNQNANKK